MDFAQAIKSGFKNYAVFGGVASRSEFWFWILFTQLVSTALSIVSGVVAPFSSSNNLDGMGSSPGWSQTWAPMLAAGSASGLSSLWSLAVFIPTLAMAARRLRDAGKSPHLLWLYLAPMSSIIFAVLTVAIYALANPSNFGFGLSDSTGIGSAWVTAAFAILGIALISLTVGILFLIWFTQPTKTAEQGNKYAVKQPSMAPPLPPIEPGTTA